MSEAQAQVSGDGTGARALEAPKPEPHLLVHAEEVKSFLERMGVSSTAGLDDAEAERRLAQHGPNRLPEEKKKSALLRILGQFVNPLVLTLLAAAAIAVVVGITASKSEGFLARFGDAIAILLIVILNAFLGY